MFTSSIFEIKKLKIPEDSEVIWVSDMFAEDYSGGAELTSEALIKFSNLKIHKVHSKDLSMDLLEQGFKKFWIFGNFSQMDIGNLIPNIITNLSYSIVEFDFKYCKYRSPEKHQEIEKKICDCDNSNHGKLISAFFYGAKSLWWMSEKQQKHYHDRFPFLMEKPNTVLSSVFDDETFALIKILRTKYKNTDRKGWIVLGSPSWIKGANTSEQWCKDNNKEYKVLWNVSYKEILNELAQAEGHVLLPPGADTCPRSVLEAKLLGCKLELNENVLHKDEEWFNTEDLEFTESYLYAARELFWNGIKRDINFNPTLSGYTTTRNCISQKYPWRESIQSLLNFCDEVVVGDGGSKDGTWEELLDLQKSNPKLKLFSFSDLDWNPETNSRFAVNDGLLKSKTRDQCSGEFCLQLDVDECIHEDDYLKYRTLIKEFPKDLDLLSLPVIEYWGGSDKVRCDINVWKWRLSRNKKYLTHGIPRSQRRVDSQNRTYSVGSDGCDMIHRETGDPVEFATFLTPDLMQLQRSCQVDENSRKQFEEYFNSIVENIPSVYHYSWWNIPRKMHVYRDYWTKHWNSLFNGTLEDLPETNMFFDKSWKDVSEEEIKELSGKLKDQMGGWVFHQRVDFSKPTKAIQIKKNMPKVIQQWAKDNQM